MPEELVISGSFRQEDGAPIAGAAVHERFLGDPPTNCGTYFDVVKAPAHTDQSGCFRLVLSDLDKALSRKGPPGTWKRGCFLVLAVKDSRTIGYKIASGDELKESAVHLTALPPVDIRGRVVDEAGRPVAGARVLVDLFLFLVGRGPYPEAPVNFWLSRAPSHQPLKDLVADTDAEGNFCILRAPAMPGELQLAVSHPDYATLETSYCPYQPPTPLVVQRGATVRMRLTLPDGTPAVGFTFDLEGEPEGEDFCTHRDGLTDQTGIVAFEGLPPGSYTVYYLGEGERTYAVPAVVVPHLAKGECREITASAVNGSLLCGRVVEAGSEAPIHHAEVRFESDIYPDTASTFQAAYTQADGGFAFRFAVAPGPLRVCVSAAHRGKRIGQRQDISVGNEPRTELTFYLPLKKGDE